MQFNLIGPFEIVADNGKTYAPSTPKVCQTLAVLLTRPNEIVATKSLIRELWEDQPPRSALTTLQTYIYHARRMFVTEELTPQGRDLLTTHPQGYKIQVDEYQVDVKNFERLVVQGQAALREGKAEVAISHLRKALELWRGPALFNIQAGSVLKGRIAFVEELRIRALELRIEAEIQLGMYREVIPELRELVNSYPLNEWFHGRLIASLHRSGRRAEALRVYQDLRRTLSEELGLEPSPELQRLQLEVLDPRPNRAPAAKRAAARTGPSYAHAGAVAPARTTRVA